MNSPERIYAQLGVDSSAVQTITRMLTDVRHDTGDATVHAALTADTLLADEPEPSSEQRDESIAVAAYCCLTANLYKDSGYTPEQYARTIQRCKIFPFNQTQLLKIGAQDSEALADLLHTYAILYHDDPTGSHLSTAIVKSANIRKMVPGLGT